MLSRVLPARDAGGIQAAVFPFFPPSAAESAERRPASSGSPEDSVQSALLRARIEQLEAQISRERHDAFEAGRSQGEQQARADVQPVIERLNHAIAEMAALRPELRRSAERDVVQLALLMAKRVLHRQLSIDEGALTALARVVFERLNRSETYSIRVHPGFAGAIRAALPASHASRVQLEPDPGCDPGTLIIQSAEGTIDASVDAQLEEINRGLTDRLANA